MDIDGYLARLGLDRPSAPTLDWLVAAHRAQVERVPYSTLDIDLGRPGPLDPAVSVDRIARTGRAGYCYQLNGAFGALLASLGFGVRRHCGAVWTSPDEPRPFPNHLALTVRLDGAEWFVDAGLGDALREPIRLTHGPVQQGPFGYRMERIDGGWRFYHDPVGAFTAMDFDEAEAPAGAFDHGHTVMSTSPECNFVTNVTVARRAAAGLDKLVNQTIRRIDRALLWRNAQAGQAAHEASLVAQLEGGHVPG